MKPEQEYILLIGESTTIGSYNVYGFPWTPEFGPWAFMYPRNGNRMKKALDRIPEDTDILVSHGPAFGTLDITGRGDRAGCELLKERIPQLKQLKAHVFGHIHESSGASLYNKLQSFNVSICNARLQPIHEPAYFEV